MEFSKIKNFIKQNGDKLIFVENGEPEAVLISFEEYQKLLNNEPFASFVPTEETEFVAEDEYDKRSGLPVRPEDIKLEDLPI